MENTDDGASRQQRPTDDDALHRLATAPTERKGGSIRTYSGIEFYPLDPRPEEICIEDIAHALSMLCRFGGHVFHFYSVAQHSLRASHIVPPADALAALLHDAAEAYLVDVPSPVKRHLLEYQRAEDVLSLMIAEKFGFAWPLPASVKAADAELLQAEQRDLFMASPRWPAPRSVLEEVYPLNQKPAKMRFLERFEELTAGRPEVAALPGAAMSVSGPHLTPALSPRGEGETRPAMSVIGPTSPRPPKASSHAETSSAAPAEREQDAGAGRVTEAAQ